MGSEAREVLEVVLSLSPWIAFVILLAWATARSLIGRSDDGNGRARDESKRAGL